jgi:hypothetical protein
MTLEDIANELKQVKETQAKILNILIAEGKIEPDPLPDLDKIMAERIPGSLARLLLARKRKPDGSLDLSGVAIEGVKRGGGNRRNRKPVNQPAARREATGQTHRYSPKPASYPPKGEATEKRC